MKKIVLFITLFLFVGCGLSNFQGEGKNSCNFRVDRGFMVRWEELPVPIYIHESVPSITRKNFVYAMDMWNESWNYYAKQGPLFELVGEVQVNSVPGQQDSGDGINILFLDKKHQILLAKQQGSTHIRNYFGGSIIEGDIIINNVHYKYFYEKESFDYSVWTKVPKLSTNRSFASTSPRSFFQQFLYAFQAFWDFISFWKKKSTRVPTAIRPEISKNEVDFISLALHEFGHLAGAIHIENKNGIMNAGLKKGQIRRDIGDIELGSLACGYEITKR